jgi:hypothetical protein
MAEYGAAPFEILGTRLEQFPFNHRLFRNLDHNHDLQFRNQQVVYQNRFAISELGFELSIVSLERRFNYSWKAMPQTMQSELEPPK